MDDTSAANVNASREHDMLTFLVESQTPEDRKTMLNTAKVKGTFFKDSSEFSQVSLVVRDMWMASLSVLADHSKEGVYTSDVLHTSSTMKVVLH